MPSSITADGTKNHCKSSTKNVMARFQRVQHTLTRKRFPILGRILDRLNAVPLYLRIVFLLLAVLWKFYIVYLLFKFLLGHNMSILSSRGIGFLRESPMAEGGANLTAGHHDSSNSISSGLVEIANSHRNKVISGHVDEEEGNNKREQRLLNYYNQDQSIKDGESSSYSHQQDRQLQAAISSNEGISNEEVSPIRVLHIVTALAEYNSGRRGTIEGQDRLQEVMIPILVDSVSSMISPPCNYEVD
eukprot:CAMPEP_0198250222 /NCGR_PEP_ID=MMETSP1447-20131203/1496_1 /TAXON_ID=420782 /ORGANISM="Chaetoceros dichaeta, Strain CCMP1751" /LENGTH=244 /DNA_ID=CAMNT_0043935029 /DNA_START=85 /DNA_END=816 /DNA_ORIENTATION=-